MVKCIGSSAAGKIRGILFNPRRYGGASFASLAPTFCKNRGAFQLTEPLYLDFRWDSLHAKIPTERMDSVANGAIQYEHTCVSGIFTALGVPGGVALVGTIPADIIQYYGYMLRAAQ